MIDPQYQLQLINEGDHTVYIVYQSKGAVVTDVEEQGGILKVKLDITKEDEDAFVQRVYKLTLDVKHHTMDVDMNGVSTPFDRVTSI